MLNMIYSISHKENIVGDFEKNDLVFSMKEDLQFFKKMTVGSTIIMGRNTFISLPTGGLPKRKHVIVTNKITNDDDAKKILGEKYIENLTYVKIEELEAFIKKELSINSIFVIGGAMLYSHFIKKSDLFNVVNNIYVTEVERVPNTKTPVILEAHNLLKTKCKAEIIKIGSAKDRLFDNNLVDYRIIRYYK